MRCFLRSSIAFIVVVVVIIIIIYSIYTAIVVKYHWLVFNYIYICVCVCVCMCACVCVCFYMAQLLTMKHEFHYGISWLSSCTHTKQLDDVFVIITFHHLGFAEEVQLYDEIEITIVSHLNAVLSQS